jgi:hypothetical protein
MQMNRPLTSDDRELIQLLLDDVEIVDDQFRMGLPKPSATRTIFAPILRRWVTESLFFTAQKLILPHQVAFSARSYAHTIKLCEAGIYEHWMGLVVFGTIGVASRKIAPQQIGPDGKLTVQLSDATELKPTPQKARNFFDQRMFFWRGRFYTRADVIKNTCQCPRRRPYRFS